MTKTAPQNDFLGAMGRKYWERVCIDKANENFCLFHFQKNFHDNTSVQYFEKHVIIFLNSSVLSLLSAILPIEFDKVRYQHKLVANNKEKTHDDDEKRFGPCKSRTTWENLDGRDMWVIRWYVSHGLLRVQHFINNDGDLQVDMSYTDNQNNTTKTTKIYERSPFTPDQLSKLDAMPYKAELRPAQV